MTVEQLHKEGLSVEDISQRLGTSKANVWKIARKHNLKFQGSGARSKVLHNPFELLNEEAQYWLGILAADGWISKKLNVIGLGLKDVEHVKKYRDFIDPSLTLHMNKTGRGTILFSNKNVKGWLTALGITPNKSLTLIVSETILTPHFVRGVFDGDGHFSKSPSRQHKITSGSLEFLKQLSDFFKNYNIAHNISIQCQGKNTTYCLPIYNKESVKLYDLLYTNATVWLERKENILCLAAERRRRKSGELSGNSCSETGQSAAKHDRDVMKVQRLTAYQKNSDEADTSARHPKG